MKDMISYFQESFIPGRKCTDNVIIVQEAAFYLKNSCQLVGKEVRCMIKIDLEKAYDRLKWSFFRDTSFFQFPSKLISLILNCVSSVGEICNT